MCIGGGVYVTANWSGTQKKLIQGIIMKDCKCGNACASNAKSCPKCGYRFTSAATKLILGLIVLVILAKIFGGLSSGVGSTSANSATPTVDAKEILLHSVKLDFKWNKSGLGSVMMANFTLNNPTAYRFKDFEIKCSHYSPSGTLIDSNTRTIYEIVEPQSKKVVKNFSMGFIHSQAASSGCEIADLKPI